MPIDAIPITARFSATDLNKSGAKVLDRALDGAVEITRREQHFVLLREEQLKRLLTEAREDRPRSLEDLLRDYDPEKIKAETRAFLDEDPAGSELI
jgi:hypothetical protein